MDTIEEYRALIEYTSDVISVLDPTGTVTYESPSVERVLGYEQDALVGEDVFDYVHPEDREHVASTFEAAVTGGADAIEPVTYRFRRADGSWCWLESTVSTASESALGGFVVTSRDISGRRAREAELDAARRRFQSLAEGLAEVVYRADPNTLAPDYVNDSIEDLTGYTAEEWVSSRDYFEDALHAEDREGVHERMQELKRTREEDVLEYRLVTRDGDVRWIRDHVSWEYDESGEVVAQLGIAYDVTAEIGYQSQLEETVRKLETLNRLVRHDIRNDMTVILGWAELLEDHVDETGARYVEKVLASGEHIVELTDVVRDYVETVASGDAMTVKPIALRYAVETEVALRRESFPEAVIEIDGAVPDVEVTANEMLPSVFRNLINNAVQHNDTGEPHVTVSVDVEPDSAVVTVADNGPGLPADLADTLFGESQKSQESGGTGMGLYLVQTLVESYGGAVWADDTTAGGVFHVRLPLADSPAEDVEREE